MFVDAVPLLCILAELLGELLNGRQRLYGEAGGGHLLEEGADGGRTFEEKEDLLVCGTVVQHGEKQLQE